MLNAPVYGKWSNFSVITMQESLCRFLLIISFFVITQITVQGNFSGFIFISQYIMGFLHYKWRGVRMIMLTYTRAHTAENAEKRPSADWSSFLFTLKAVFCVRAETPSFHRSVGVCEGVWMGVCVCVGGAEGL